MYVKYCNIKAPWGIRRHLRTVPTPYTDAAGSASRPNPLAVGWLMRQDSFPSSLRWFRNLTRQINSEP